MELDKQIAKRIKDYLDDKCIKNNFICKGLNMSIRKVSYMVNGLQKIYVSDYLRLCKLLNVKPSYFLDELI